MKQSFPSTTDPAGLLVLAKWSSLFLLQQTLLVLAKWSVFFLVQQTLLVLAKWSGLFLVQQTLLVLYLWATMLPVSLWSYKLSLLLNKIIKEMMTTFTSGCLVLHLFNHSESMNLHEDYFTTQFWKRATTNYINCSPPKTQPFPLLPDRASPPMAM